MNYTLIFDMDGVLVDSEHVILAAAMAGLAEYGVKSAPGDFTPFIGAGEDKFIGGVAEKYGVPYKLEMKKRVYDIYLDVVAENLKIYPGVNRLLETLRSEGRKMVLASSADRVKVDANLKVANIPQETFAAVISGEDVINKKPSPDIFLEAAKRAGSEPKECIVVEDAVNGIRAAKAAGMKCIAVASTFPRQRLEEEKPDYAVDEITGIYSILGSL